MANNLFGNIPACIVAKQTATFAEMGFDATNTYIIYEVGNPLKSWDPTRGINAITGAEINKGYYMVPKTDMDKTAYFAPPFTTTPPESFWGVELNEQILNDDGLYNAFFMPEQIQDGRLLGPYKKSAGHAAMGPLTWIRSTAVADVFEEFETTISAVTINSAAHSWCQTLTGRILVAFQDNETYTNLKIAYTDGDPADGFTLLHTIDLGVGYSSSPCPCPMVVLPEGTIRFYVYRFGLGPNPAIVQDIKLTDNGNTWEWGAEIFNHTNDYPTGFPEWKVHETCPFIIENTGVEATTKLLAFGRVAISDDGGVYYLCKYSNDGGETWNWDTTTEDPGSFVNDNGATVGGPFNRGLLYRFLGSNSPVNGLEINGIVIAFNGERNGVNGYKPKFTTATVLGAIENKFDNWAPPTAIDVNYNAFSLGSSIDCGYCVPLVWRLTPGGAVHKVFEADYDVSTEPKDPGITEDRCFVRLKEVTLLLP